MLQCGSLNGMELPNTGVELSTINQSIDDIMHIDYDTSYKYTLAYHDPWYVL